MQSLYVVESLERSEQTCSFFKAHYPQTQIVVASDGPIAVEKITLEGPFSSIFIDATIKSIPPCELAKKLLDIAGQRPVVFLGDKKEINAYIDDKLFLEEDCQFEVLYLPLVPTDIKEKMKEISNWAEKENFAQSLCNMDSDSLLPIRVRNFYLFSSLPYDVFIELTPYKFLKIINKDEKYTISHLTKFTRKNIRYFLLEKDDFILFIEKGMAKVSTFLKRKNLKTHELLALYTKGLLLLHQYINQLGISDDIVIFTNLLIKSFGNVYNANKKSFIQLLRMIPFDNKDSSERAVMNIFLCYGALNQLDWNAGMTRGKLALAAILSDSTVELDYLLDITSTDEQLFTELKEAEKQRFMNHPLKAAEYSKHFQGYYSDVDFIIAQHHETPLGDGFPTGLNHSKLTSLSCLFIITTRFVNEVCRSGPTFDATEILKVLKLEYNIGHFKAPLDALSKALKK